MSILKSFQDSIETKKAFISNESNIEKIRRVSELCIQAFKNNGKVLLCGNGGSASDAQHIAAELSGRFNYDRDPLFAEALHVNTSFTTAVANDYSYDVIYSRMVKAAGREGDVLIGLSTSGNSMNIVNALKEGNNQGMITVALTGEKKGLVDEVASIVIKVPSANTARVQETHILIGHAICEIIENTMFPKNA